MKIVKITDGRISIVNERGILLRPIFGRNVVSAFLNDKMDLIVATNASGKVELLNERGLLQRTIKSTGAVNARFSGDDILVETDKGKIEIRSQTGLLKRTV